MHADEHTHTLIGKQIDTHIPASTQHLKMETGKETHTHTYRQLGKSHPAISKSWLPAIS